MDAKKLLISMICAMAALSAIAQLSYADAKVRADRSFGYREWATASALYNYMIGIDPGVPDTYGRAIVTNAMLNDSIRSMELLTEAMAHNIPLDSVLTQVQKYSFIIGRGNLYKDFMLQASETKPWLARPLDKYLLRYYTFRNDGPKMVEYAQRMLNGAPDNADFLFTLAKGYMLQDDPQPALAVWQKIITLHPQDYNAMLNLASYYDLNGQPADALHYFSMAARLHPTPYVEAAISRLSDSLQQAHDRR